jgi:hypothetical protein
VKNGMEHRLAGWKRLYLSKGGRLTLIKKENAFFPICLLITCLFSLTPVGVANWIEKLQRNFLWGGISDKFKFHLVNWSKVCSLMSSNGLGVKNLIRFN